MKFGYRECLQMPARRLRKFYGIAVEYFEALEKKNKELDKQTETNP